MTVTDTTLRAQTDAIAFEIDLPQTPEKVWRALTDPELLAEWLLPVVEMNLEPGAAFTFTAQPQPGWDGRVNCRLLEIYPWRKLSYTWEVGDPASGFHLDTVVTFTLAPSASGTRLSRPVRFQTGAEAELRRRALRLEDDGR
jgi:uncharacterized protein YndB with AHSA1/START domain